MSIRYYLALDGITQVPFDPDHCLRWQLFPRKHPKHRKPKHRGPGRRLLEVVLHFTPDGYYVEYRLEDDPCNRFETYCEVDRAYAHRRLEEIAEKHPDLERYRPDGPWLECSQNELAEAMGYKPGYTGLIKILRAELIITHLEKVNAHKSKVWFDTPERYREILGKVERIRAARQAEQQARRSAKRRTT
jgi:hypothetical protein